MNSQRTNNFDRESAVSEDGDGSDFNEGSNENFVNEYNFDSSSFHEEVSRLNWINSLTKVINWYFSIYVRSMELKTMELKKEFTIEELLNMAKKKLKKLFLISHTAILLTKRLH